MSDGSLLWRLQCQLIPDLDATDDALGARAKGDIVPHRLPGLLPLLRGGLEVVVDMDSRDFEHAFDIFDIA